MTEEKIIRKTITMDSNLYDTIQKIRAGLMSNGLDMSFTTTVNVVLISGIVGSEKFDDEIWKEIAQFFQSGPEEDIGETINQYTEFLLSKLKRLRELHDI